MHFTCFIQLIHLCLYSYTDFIYFFFRIFLHLRNLEQQNNYFKGCHLINICTNSINIRPALPRNVGPFGNVRFRFFDVVAHIESTVWQHEHVLKQPKHFSTKPIQSGYLKLRGSQTAKRALVKPQQIICTRAESFGPTQCNLCHLPIVTLFLSIFPYPFVSSNLFPPNLPSININTRTSQASNQYHLYIPLCCYCCIFTFTSPFGRLAEADSPKTTSMVLLSVNSFTQGQYNIINLIYWKLMKYQQQSFVIYHYKVLISLIIIN